jgi:hypothetical protein
MAQDPDANCGGNGGFEDEGHGDNDNDNNNNNDNNSNLNSDNDGGDSNYHSGNSGEDDDDSDVFIPVVAPILNRNILGITMIAAMEAMSLISTAKVCICCSSPPHIT